MDLSRLKLCQSSSKKFTLMQSDKTAKRPSTNWKIKDLSRPTFECRYLLMLKPVAGKSTVTCSTKPIHEATEPLICDRVVHWPQV